MNISVTDPWWVGPPGQPTATADDNDNDENDDDNEDAKKFSAVRTFFKKKKITSRLHERFRPRIIKIGAILAIFEPFEV